MRETDTSKTPLPVSADRQLLTVTGVTKRYGQRVAVDALTLSVRAGEVFGLVGANGGGKTTTLRILAGILTPDEGQGQVLGFDLTGRANEIRSHVGYMSQRLSLYTALSVFENLRFRAQVYGVNNPRATTEAVIADFGLTAYRRTAAGQLSGGWARRLHLAAALIHSPQLILLDEPTAGLDAVSRHEVWQRIEQLAVQGAGIIVSTHDLAEAERCTHAIFLSEGRTVMTGTPEQLAQGTPAVAYLLSGGEVRLLTTMVAALPGVIASYPHGSSVRVLAHKEAEAPLRRLTTDNGSSLIHTEMRLADAALVFARLSSRSQT